MVFIRLYKLQEFTSQAAVMLQAPKADVDTLEQFLGILAWFTGAVDGARLFRRGMDSWLRDNRGVVSAVLSVSAKGELMFWAEHADDLNGLNFQPKSAAEVTVVADSSEDAWAGAFVRSNVVIYACWGDLPEWALGESSHCRELTGLWSSLVACPVELKDCEVITGGDSSGALSSAKNMSGRAEDSARAMKLLWVWCRERNVTLRDRWSKRSEGYIPFVDWMGKARPATVDLAVQRPILQPPPPIGSQGTAEWSLNDVVFKKICDWAFGEGNLPEVDLFATGANRKCPRFFSWLWDPEAAGEAFTESWDGLRCYGFPPFSQLGRVLQRLGETKDSTVLLVLAHDRSDPLYPVLLEWEHRGKVWFLPWVPGVIFPRGGEPPIWQPAKRLKALCVKL